MSKEFSVKKEENLSLLWKKNPNSIRNMLLGLEMADQVDQSFVKVHFHRMTTEYFNELMNKIMDKETDMVAMRKKFLRDNQE